MMKKEVVNVFAHFMLASEFLMLRHCPHLAGASGAMAVTVMAAVAMMAVVVSVS